MLDIIRQVVVHLQRQRRRVMDVCRVILVVNCLLDIIQPGVQNPQHHLMTKMDVIDVTLLDVGALFVVWLLVVIIRQVVEHLQHRLLRDLVMVLTVVCLVSVVVRNGQHIIALQVEPLIMLAVLGLADSVI